ncbi:MAG: plasmid stabilization protein [Zetaproteobacteria bacterium CG_4_9_14_3_um_filter_49_83]|nr:MAG: plasmid stabilization protein [Zetaproteobacteria bacterium CG1_02_49_23]PIQ34087.1 MAG: plasmid stabilization protein [Zetaproteobacteria bacterium CG17_big_fil_post_rev_8_21_14_2_50_50_13]PIV30236.1 MAG: plasmid stabilization protein [Zetaproteobacteria bacterium CG02_land_8_20_14_3_00_50_9]PIY55865.1 MAG: plasmid stabilization protein [Zetaproteobacteria bacterium CG_4_10_14_0_8_um_filter_49_80]PJA34995.1 MAG: plasmid stabilization protein [Zetaproteobacteria bacterium CG_4_9_14_3_um
MSAFEVFLTEDGSRDLLELYDYIAKNDSPVKADHLLENIEPAFTSLGEFPERGTYPPELLDIGIREYRKRFFKPYRIIYRVIGQHVYVLLIAEVIATRIYHHPFI